MEDEIPPPGRPYRMRRPSSSLISSTTSPIFPAPHPPPNPNGPGRPSSSRTNALRDIDDDIQPSSSTPSFGSSRLQQRFAQNNHNHSNHPSSSSSIGRSSSPLGSPDSTFWGPAPSPLNNITNSSLNAGPPTPGGNCVVSSSTVDDIPPSPFSPEENISGNLMLPPLSNSSSSNLSAAVNNANAVSVISGNYSNNNSSNNDSNDLPGSSSHWDPQPGPGGLHVRAASTGAFSSSLLGSSLSLGGNSYLSGRSTASASSSSSRLGQIQQQPSVNESYNSSISNNTVSSFNLSPVRSKIKKASSFERFSAQAQASSNNSNNNNNTTSGNNSANPNSETTTTTVTTTSTIVLNQTSISNANAPVSTSTVAAGASGTSSCSSRLLWDYTPSLASSASASSSSSIGTSSASASSSRLTSTMGGNGSLSSTLGESFSSTKPFHLKKLAAKIASVFEQEQLMESAAASLTGTSQPHQIHQQQSSVEDGMIRHNQENSLGNSIGLPQPRGPTSGQSPLNSNEGIGVGTSLSSTTSSPPKAKNTLATPVLPTKSFLTKNIPLTPKQKLLQRLQSGELFNSLSPPPVPIAPPPVAIPPQPQPQVPIQSTIQQQHQILLSSLQQPPSTSLLSDALHLHQQHENLMDGGRSPTPPPLSPSSSPTPRASAELDRYVNSMTISNYEAFIRASDEVYVQDTLGKNADPEDLSNIQVLYDPGDSYGYYYGNILVDDMDFTSASSSNIPGCSAAGNSSSSGGRQLLVMPPGSSLEDPVFQTQQLQQSHGHLEFVLGLNSQEDQRQQHEIREEDLQLGDISHHQSFLDPNDGGMSLSSMGKNQAESTLRNLLMMEPMRVHDDSWISAATAAEYQSRLGQLGIGGPGGRGINLNTSGGSSGGNSSSLSLSNSWINDWPPRTSSWQQSHHDLVDQDEQNEVMDMSILDMTDKNHGHGGKRQGHGHSQGQGGIDVDVDLVEESSAGLSLLMPMDLQQPLSLSLTSSKNSTETEPIDLQHPHQQHQHPHHRARIENQNNEDEPVNLMAVVNLEHEMAQAQAHHHQSQQDLVQAQMQNSNSVYSNGSMFTAATVPPKVLSPPSTNFSHSFNENQQQQENSDDRKIILMKKGKEIDPLGSSKLQQQVILMSSSISPSSTSSETPGFVAANVILDKPVKKRAYASLPGLLNISRLGENGYTIVTNRNKIIAPNTRFGPVEGPLRKVYQEDLDTTDAVYPCLIMVDSTTNTFWQLDREDDDSCNWMKFVRMAHSSASQNILISESNGLLFFTTCRNIPPKVELQAGYDFEYAQRYGLQYLEPILTDQDEELLRPEPPPTEILIEEDIVESFVCFECETDFSTPEEFNEHVETAHREPEIEPKKKAAVRRFLNSKSANSIKKAKTVVSSSSKAKNSKKTSSSGLPMTGTILCKHCGGVYLSMDELKTHLRESAPCGRTGSIEVLVLKAKENVEVAIEDKPEETAITTNLATPVKPQPKAKCQICYKGFATRDRLDRHMLVHNEEDLKPLQCNFCVKRFLTNSALAGHVKTHAEEGKCFECPMCSFVTQQLLPLKEHVQSHKNKENGMFHCPHCVKKFSVYSMVRKHIRAFHGPRQFTCEHCPMSFPSSDKLKLHKLKHSDHREFLCAECGRQFKRKDKLREHSKRMHDSKKKHVPIKPEVLQHIPTKKEKLLKKFNSKVSQEEFSRFVYKCMDCMLGFKRRGMLVNHLAKRHPDKPRQNVPELNLPILRPSRNYLCPYCDRIYKSSSKRKSHILKSHPGKQVPPQLRGRETNSIGKRAFKTENSPVITVKMGGNTNSPGVELFSVPSQHIDRHTVETAVPAMTAVDDNGVSGNVIVSRRDPVLASPHGCQWCHRQYATRAKLLQHQRKSHLHLMPPEIQTPRTQKNNVSRSVDNGGVITVSVSVTDVAPLHAQTLQLLQSSSHVYTTLDQEILGNNSEKLPIEGNVDNSVIGYLLTTTTVTNGDFESALEPEIVMMSQGQGHGQSNQLTNNSSTPALTAVSISAKDLEHQNIVNVNHVISSTGLNLNLNPILTKTDD